MIINEDHLRDIENLGWRHEKVSRLSLGDLIETIRALRKILEIVINQCEPRDKSDRGTLKEAIAILKETK